MGDVNSAVDTVKDRLDQGFLDWDVTHGDLTDISAAVNELEPSERNELISRLSDDDLKNWTQEIDGLNGALSAEERQDLFNKLAEGLDGEQLTRLVEAFDGSPGGREALGAAVAQHASSEAKVAFVQATAGSIDAEYSAQQGRWGNAETVVIASILSSLAGDPDAFGQALGSLSDSQLRDVMEVGLGRTYVAGHNYASTSVNASVTAAIIAGAANLTDPALKARVFEIGAQQIAILRDETINPLGGADAPAAQITAALTQLLDSDTTGVVRELETAFRDGKGLTSYLAEQLEHGGEAGQKQIGEFIAKLQSGNDLSEDPQARFLATDADGNYRNAQMLGYFMGGVEAGINIVAGNRADEAAMIATVFKGVVGAFGAINPGTGVAASGVSTLTDLMVTSAADGYKNDASNLRDTLTSLAYPRDDQGRPFEGEQAETPYDTALLRVVNANRFE
ncbi:hypothetical protein IP90_00143 [Luteimonas cucumeris]|uniref:Uncharacterized protein n=1 Tax=Luteimonas cucumeris TaxID=985012 RepID=A0A562LE03_9GAMM|nr:hypothetical protein [Luteimonas cucumeris]TWI05881.1 hypothetical protein IP90_00143 [Luteimonas cucumeris]